MCALRCLAYQFQACMRLRRSSKRIHKITRKDQRHSFLRKMTRWRHVYEVKLKGAHQDMRSPFGSWAKCIGYGRGGSFGTATMYMVGIVVTNTHVACWLSEYIPAWFFYLPVFWDDFSVLLTLAGSRNVALFLEGHCFVGPRLGPCVCP